jgi:acyl-CoA synthetase (NDP forming)
MAPGARSARFRRGAMIGLGQPPMIDPTIFRPRTIAVLGASPDPGQLGHRPLSYLARTGFAGSVYPVNPRHPQIGDLRCYPDLESVPEQVDVALVGLAANRVGDALEACAARGVRLAVVLSAGVPDDLTPPDGLTVMGPNSMGFLANRGPIAATWNSTLDLGVIKTGHVALVAQSGGLGGTVLNRLADRGVGVSWAFWSGEERFLDTCDLLEMLLQDSDTRVVVLLLEGVRRPRHFIALAARARERGVPILAFKLARSPRSAAVALAHTGILAGRRRVQQAAFRQVGILEAERLDDLIDLAVLFSTHAQPLGGRIAALTTSGGAGILLADVADQLGLELPRPADDTVDALRAILPPYVSIENPLDITAGLPESVMMGTLSALARDPGIDLIVPLNTMIGGAAKLTQRARGLIELAPSLPKPLLSCWLGGSLSTEGVTLIRDADLPYFLSIEGCLHALAAARSYHARRPVWISA